MLSVCVCVLVRFPTSLIVIFSLCVSMCFLIYIYIVIHRQICFVQSELTSGARHTRFP